MGAITEAFTGLTDVLFAEDAKPAAKGSRKSTADVVSTHLLKPFLPSAIRWSAGTILDIKDRQAGPFDLIGAWEAYPPVGEGVASIYPIDGVIFCLQVRHWASQDLTEFAALAGQLRKLERHQSRPLFCGAVSFDPLSLEQVLEFLRSPGGQSVDAVLSLGNNVVIRNTQGIYGDPQKVPFVTERNGPEALKAFTLSLLQLSQSFIGMPFGLSEYQHL